MKRNDFYWLMAAIYLAPRVSEATGLWLGIFFCILGLMAEYAAYKAAA